MAGGILWHRLAIGGTHAVENWKELKGDHFIIYYANDEHFAGEVLRKAEGYYQQISTDLGYQRYTNFWQWDKRVKIFIYSKRRDFFTGTGQPKWSRGVADYFKKEIRSYQWSEGFLEALLPHEITHLIFRDYVGFKGEISLWLDEGVAQWEEPGKRIAVRRAMQAILQQGKEFPLKDFTEMDVRQTKDEATVTRFYVQAVSLIEFLVGKYGADDFIQFCRQLRDGKRLEDALRFTYPTTMRNLKEMEKNWKEHALQE